MTPRRFQFTALFIVRLVVGVYFLDFGFSALWTPGWSLTSFISGARTFSSFYHALAVPSVLPMLGLIIALLSLAIGALLVLGIFVRLASFVGIILMLFFYFPVLAFPYVCATSVSGVSCGGSPLYLVDTYLLVAAALAILWTFKAGKFLSLGKIIH